MDLTIKECNMLVSGLSKLASIKMNGSLRFDVVRNMKTINDILESAIEANDGNTIFSDELLKKQVNVDVIMFNTSDFNDIAIEPMALYEISKLIKDL